MANWIFEILPCSWHTEEWLGFAFWVYFEINLIFYWECRLLDWGLGYIVQSFFLTVIC